MKRFNLLLACFLLVGVAVDIPTRDTLRDTSRAARRRRVPRA